jgi:hypothetical protein
MKEKWSGFWKPDHKIIVKSVHDYWDSVYDQR